jgi:hypothetical protein
MDGAERKVQPGFGTCSVWTGLRGLCRVELLADAIDSFRPFFRGCGSSPVLLHADLFTSCVAAFFLLGTSDLVVAHTRIE